jgi:hypothetical protein
MDVKEAVRNAKAFLSDLIEDEQPQNVGLEEVEFDENRSAWIVTLSYSRPWFQTDLSKMTGSESRLDREFKTMALVTKPVRFPR